MRTRNIVLAALAVTLGLATVAEAAWIQYTNRVRRPDGNLKHTQSLDKRVVITKAADASEICVLYQNRSDKKSQGKVVATATVHLPDGEEPQTFALRSGVKKNRAQDCVAGPAMPVGTIVDYHIDFENMPLVLGKKGQFSDVRSVISELEEIPVERPSLIPADEDEGGVIVSASAMFVPEKDSQKHPGGIFLSLVPTRELTEPTVCALYQNNLAKKNKGRVVTKVTVLRGEEEEAETLTLSRKVSRNTSEDCKPLQGGPVDPDSTIEFDVDFRNVPKLASVDSSYVDISALVSGAGEATFETVTAVDESPGGGGGGGADPPASGGISADDQRAVSKLLLNNNKVQLQRPKGDNPAKFVALGPASTVLASDPGRVDPATAGLGNTIAAAVADYERKKGSLGPAGNLLNSRDLAEIQWYANMNTASGPTAIRKDAGGGWHSEYWRPSTGNVFNKAGSMAGAIEILRRQGL